ncbi:MAG TPA: HEAT repeat domain-containing protein [Gemmatimonadaceae bacterium]|nr:HEAT repeat domain-containing protein [Gemmatimonadaceae bacterium]
MTVTSLPNATAPESELPEPPFAIALVTDLLSHLTRAIRAHQLYLHNNPTYLRAIESARRAFQSVWNHTEEIAFEVTETQLKWEDRVVLNEPDKATESLPWLLYKDGVRELRLLRDVEQQELTDLIDLLCRVRRASADEDDLLTLLWEREFNCVRYRYVDLTLEAEPIERLDDGARARLKDSAKEQAPLQEQILPAGVVSLDAFDTTLYFLDESEIEYLRNQIRAEYAADLRKNVLDALLDIYETQADERIRREIVELLNLLLVTLLVGGHYSVAAYLLREVRVSSEKAAGLSGPEREALLSLSAKLSEQDVLTQLLTALDERADLPPEEDLESLFAELRGSALGIVFLWLSRLQSPRVRALLEKAADRLASANTAELVKLIASAEREVSLEAVRRAGAMRANGAVPALAKLMTQPDPALRLAAVVALGEIASPGALQHLEKAIDDHERDVRVAAAKVFAARTHRPALARFEGAIKSRRMDGTDLTERMAFFEAYGAMCGEAGVALLDGFLNNRSLFGKKSDPELRACAAKALGKIGSAKALESLRKSSDDKDVLVRTTVNKALRGGDR